METKSAEKSFSPVEQLDSFNPYSFSSSFGMVVSKTPTHGGAVATHLVSESWANDDGVRRLFGERLGRPYTMIQTV